jgi:hypothetical protein
MAGSAAVRVGTGSGGGDGRVAESSSAAGCTGCVSIEVKPLGRLVGGLGGAGATGAGTTGGSARVLASAIGASAALVVAAVVGASTQPQLAHMPAPLASGTIARPHC